MHHIAKIKTILKRAENNLNLLIFTTHNVGMFHCSPRFKSCFSYPDSLCKACLQEDLHPLERVLIPTVQNKPRHTKLNTKADTHTHSTLTTMENAAHTVQLSVAGGSLAGCEVSHWHTNTQRIIRAAHGNIHRTGQHVC